MPRRKLVFRYHFLAVVLAVSLSPRLSVAAGTDLSTGKEIYAERCQNCHGRGANLRAMGRSKMLNRVPAHEIEEALRAHQELSPKAGTEMKDRMKAGLSDAEIKDLGAYIDTLRR